jgi:hypothetical protein
MLSRQSRHNDKVFGDIYQICKKFYPTPKEKNTHARVSHDFDFVIARDIFASKNVFQSRPEHPIFGIVLSIFWLKKLNLSSSQKRLKSEHGFTDKNARVRYDPCR